TVQDVQPKITTSTNTTNRVDGNNVDIDKQMVELADTTLNYNALVQVISARLALTRYIVNEGRR
ncbi:MAG: flagellar basal body rod protein FlgB, partial [Chloroflexi bacterium]|nr:flagellar basal body rod protein FlgB [Chloroflexota bacterium]